MRGLTPAERILMRHATEEGAPYKLLSVEELMLCLGLERSGRLTTVGKLLGAIDLGRLALRVCPMDES